MLPWLAYQIDSLTTSVLGRMIQPPAGYCPPSEPVPDRPEDIAWPGPIRLDVKKRLKGEIDWIHAPSPVRSPWPESQTIHGRAFGPASARSAILFLHGAYDVYTPFEKMGARFARRGFRVIIPAAPCHLERAPRGTHNGAPFFWSHQSVLLGMAQWLAELHGVIQGLRQQGFERIGIFGYSIGSLTAGLAATLWPDLDFVVLLAPVGHHLQAIREARVSKNLWPWMTTATPEERHLFDQWAPAIRDPVARRSFFLIPRFDGLQPTELQLAMWQRWGSPFMRLYRHGHISVCFSPRMSGDLGVIAASLEAA
jgi:dienelactone hydrolase